MKKKVITLNESQLRAMIEESVVNCINEGFWGGLKGAAKGAGQAVSGEWNKFKNGVMNSGLKNEYNGQNASSRANAFGNMVKKGYQTGDKNQDLQKIIGYLQNIVTNNTLGNAGTQAANTLIGLIKKQVGGNNGRMSDAYNRNYGTQQTSQIRQNHDSSRAAE